MTPDDFRAVVRDDLRAALAAGDRLRLRVLRVISAAIENAAAVPSDHGADPVEFGTAEVPRGSHTIEDLARVLEAEIQDRVAVREDYARQGRADEIDAEVEVIRGYVDRLG